jgi:hypothetical protein
MRSKAHKIDAAFAQERSVLVKKVIELQVTRGIHTGVRCVAATDVCAGAS